MVVIGEYISIILNDLKSAYLGQAQFQWFEKWVALYEIVKESVEDDPRQGKKPIKRNHKREY